MNELITKHHEKKEAFLKACTMTRRTANTFLKYANRCLQFFNQPMMQVKWKSLEARVKGMLEELLNQENRVLEYWTRKKKQLDQTQQFYMFERSAHQSLVWIKEEGDIYLSTHKDVGKTKEETQSLLKEHNSFKENAKKTKDTVKLLLQLADSLDQKGHVYAMQIKSWVEEVDNTYKDFSMSMESYRVRLETHLGIDQELVDQTSISQLNSTTSNASTRSELTCSREPSHACGSVSNHMEIKAFDEDKQKSARRCEFIMAELLETERSYVKDLETAVQCFLLPMQTNPDQVPLALLGKEDIIFGNLKEILAFHKTIFLKALEKYECIPENVGHAFVTWVLKFNIYVKYCTNKPHASQLLIQHGVEYFDSLQQNSCLDHPVESYLIKPVQRITKYQLLLKDLLNCSRNQDQGEIKEGLEVCLSVPKKANDALHLSMLEGCDVTHETLGEVLMQERFQILDPKQIIRKVKERHIFLFELYLIFAKEVKDNNGRAIYAYKSKLLVADMGIIEQIEGDECKLAVWTGRKPLVENKMVLKASSVNAKNLWVKRILELIQDTHFNSNLPSINNMSKFSKEFEDNALLDCSIASFDSDNTIDSDHRRVVESKLLA